MEIEPKIDLAQFIFDSPDLRAGRLGTTYVHPTLNVVGKSNFSEKDNHSQTKTWSFTSRAASPINPIDGNKKQRQNNMLLFELVSAMLSLL
jgi:hypothetical protein